MPVNGVPFTPPSGGRHVYELRTYTAHYQQLPDWLGEFTGILPTRQQYSKIVGLWTTDVGPLNQAIHMWAYDDLNQRAEVRATVLKDPRWQEFLPRSTPLLAEMQSVILIPVPSSPLQ